MQLTVAEPHDRPTRQQRVTGQWRWCAAGDLVFSRAALHHMSAAAVREALAKLQLPVASEADLQAALKLLPESVPPEDKGNGEGKQTGTGKREGQAKGKGKIEEQVEAQGGVEPEGEGKINEATRWKVPPQLPFSRVRCKTCAAATPSSTSTAPSALVRCSLMLQSPLPSLQRLSD